MTIRIPYPIPMPERADLVAAGIAACRHAMNSPERARASAEVRKIVADIAFEYGIDDGLDDAGGKAGGEARHTR